MKIALVHDYLNQYGGAERVLDEFHAMFPDAPVYTSIHEPSKMPAAYRDWDIRHTWMQRLPMVQRKHQRYLPLYPLAFESMDLGEYDLVLSSSSGFCHGVLTGPQTCHVCYCHSPTRFMWDYFNYARREGLSRFQQRVLAPMLLPLRMWDRVSADRVDYWVSTSRLVEDRILKFYRRESVIIPPPVNTKRFEVSDGHDDYYLVLARLVGWKRVDIAVEAASRLGVRLKVAGDGREMPRLKAMAGPTVEFVGRVGDAEMKSLYARCKAFILTGEEDFGITPLEAMAAGRPVIAYGAGGVLDTVLPGVTGEFFRPHTAEALAEVLSRFEPERYDSAAIRRHAETYDSEVFRKRMLEYVTGCLESFRTRVPTDAALPGAAGT